MFKIHVCIHIKVEGRGGFEGGVNRWTMVLVEGPVCSEASYSNRRGSASGAVDGLQNAALPPPGLRVPLWIKKKKQPTEATAHGSAEGTYRELSSVSHSTESLIWFKDTGRGKGGNS